MKILHSTLLAVLMTTTLDAAVLLDDDWDDGDRTDTNLPEESAWFSSVTGGNPTLSAAANALTATVRVGDNLSSRLWITHFTPAGSPAELAPGDTLKLTLNFVPRGVSTSNTASRGFRIGIFNFSEPDAARVTADGFSTGAGAGAPGTNVTGYMLNMNMGQTFMANGPLELMKRIDMANINLMGASGAFARLGNTGGGLVGHPGFSNDVPYTFEFSIRRFAAAVEITTTFSDTNGWSISHSATDSASPTFRFDGFALRPATVLDTVEAFTFTRLKVETIPFAVKITSIRFTSPLILELRWDSLPGRDYEVSWRDGLEANKIWNPLGTVPAQDITASIEDGDAGFYPQRFYRVFQVPLAP